MTVPAWKRHDGNLPRPGHQGESSSSTSKMSATARGVPSSKPLVVNLSPNEEAAWLAKETQRRRGERWKQLRQVEKQKAEQTRKANAEKENRQKMGETQEQKLLRLAEAREELSKLQALHESVLTATVPDEQVGDQSVNVNKDKGTSMVDLLMTSSCSTTSPRGIAEQLIDPLGVSSYSNALNGSRAAQSKDTSLSAAWASKKSSCDTLPNTVYGKGFLRSEELREAKQVQEFVDAYRRDQREKDTKVRFQIAYEKQVLDAKKQREASQQRLQQAKEKIDSVNTRRLQELRAKAARKKQQETTMLGEKADKIVMCQNTSGYVDWSQTRFHVVRNTDDLQEELVSTVASKRAALGNSSTGGFGNSSNNMLGTSSSSTGGAAFAYYGGAGSAASGHLQRSSRGSPGALDSADAQAILRERAAARGKEALKRMRAEEQRKAAIEAAEQQKAFKRQASVERIRYKQTRGTRIPAVGIPQTAPARRSASAAPQRPSGPSAAARQTLSANNMKNSAIPASRSVGYSQQDAPREGATRSTTSASRRGASPNLSMAAQSEIPPASENEMGVPEASFASHVVHMESTTSSKMNNNNFYNPYAFNPSSRVKVNGDGQQEQEHFHDEEDQVEEEDDEDYNPYASPGKTGSAMNIPASGAAPASCRSLDYSAMSAQHPALGTSVLDEGATGGQSEDIKMAETSAILKENDKVIRDIRDNLLKRTGLDILQATSAGGDGVVEHEADDFIGNEEELEQGRPPNKNTSASANKNMLFYSGVSDQEEAQAQQEEVSFSSSKIKQSSRSNRTQMMKETKTTAASASASSKNRSRTGSTTSLSTSIVDSKLMGGLAALSKHQDNDHSASTSSIPRVDAVLQQGKERIESALRNSTEFLQRSTTGGSSSTTREGAAGVSEVRRSMRGSILGGGSTASMPQSLRNSLDSKHFDDVMKQSSGPGGATAAGLSPEASKFIAEAFRDGEKIVPETGVVSKSVLHNIFFEPLVSDWSLGDERCKEEIIVRDRGSRKIPIEVEDHDQQEEVEMEEDQLLEEEVDVHDVEKVFPGSSMPAVVPQPAINKDLPFEMSSSSSRTGVVKNIKGPPPRSTSRSPTSNSNKAGASLAPMRSAGEGMVATNLLLAPDTDRSLSSSFSFSRLAEGHSAGAPPTGGDMDDDAFNSFLDRHTENDAAKFVPSARSSRPLGRRKIQDLSTLTAELDSLCADLSVVGL
ncbi:unnamed protein product [Amoebophrya sp. A25]|nr:unnamed protein product [Amoebophrya sp. A25]|eukprot:GSA25T00009677001.1